MARVRATDFFKEEERERIEAAVRDAETRTSGEIVPMIVDESYDYPRTEILAAGLFSLATAVSLSWAFGDSSVWVFLPLFLIGFLPFRWLLGGLPDLKRRLIHPDEITAEVEEKAMVSFLDRGLHRTVEGTGVLILLSLFEHRVFILAGRGIDQKVPAGTWDHLVEMITDGIHQGRACDALCAAVTQCGDLLAEQFPPRADDTDELPNLIIE
jgi:putative membrane protein